MGIIIYYFQFCIVLFLTLKGISELAKMLIDSKLEVVKDRYLLILINKLGVGI